MNMIKVNSLYYYPVKSCAGISLSKGMINNRGFMNDRIFMIIDSENNFISQRTHPALALIQPFMDIKQLNLMAPGLPDITITYHDQGQTIAVKVWNDVCSAVEQSEEVNRWISEYLNIPARLVMMAKSFVREVDKTYNITQTSQTAFSDGYPFLLLSQASLKDLNGRLESPLPMNRFRPNIVVEGCEPYAEDTWKAIKIGETIFEVVKPCVRCVITTLDQKSLQKSKEPLTTLSTYRKTKSGGVVFGQNLIHKNNSPINIDEEVQVLALVK